MSIKEIKKLEKKILENKELYYKGKAKISDVEYDALEESLRKIDPLNPVLTLVGHKVKNSKKIKHAKKMLSLDKSYEIKDLIKWKKNEDLVVTHKIDGSSCSLAYKDGKLDIAKTRGDGLFGEDILNKALFIENIPKSIDSKEEIEVRGEIFCTNNSFLDLKNEMLSSGMDAPSSQRNIVAGILGRKENFYLAKYLSFYAFEVIKEIKEKNEIQNLEFLKKINFKTPDFFKVQTKNEIEKVINDYKEFNINGEYLVDGLVFTINDCSKHDELGETAHHPKYKMAFKIQGEIKNSEIEDILWNVSRNGILTPVAKIKPVDLSGAIITNVTLHNYGLVLKNKIKKGDIIEIVRSGEVIPKYLKTIKSSKNKLNFPKVCPSCNEEVVIEDIRLICNNKKCISQVIHSLNYFVKKIGIDDLSEKRIEEMLSKKVISTIPDLYKLKKKDFLTLDKVKEKLSDKLYMNIQNSKNTTLVKFISSLGLTGGAENTCQKIVDAGYNSVEKILEIRKEDLIELEGFAEKSSESFVNSLGANKPLITRLLEYDFVFEKIEEKKTYLEGINFCITGKLEKPRSEIEKNIKMAGGKVSKSVSSKTNILVCNEMNSNSSKFKKAKELGIEIITEKDLEEKIRNEDVL